MIDIMQLDFGTKKVKFHRKESKRVLIGDGLVAVSADVVLADGTEYDAITIHDEHSSGEHCGTLLWLDDGITDQQDRDFLERLGKTSEQVFPYRYKYREELSSHDIHLDKNGWGG